MKMSQLFSQTLRETPSEAEVASHQLLLRAGYIRQVGAGLFTFLPLARRVQHKIEKILREEMDRIGGQEVLMPVTLPASLWKESGRWEQVDVELGRFKDRLGRDMLLAMTHEEAMVDLARKELRSYRQLPAILYHIQTKWRDDPRPRAGLIRVREFTMKDSYSLAATWEELESQYEAHYQAYLRIYQRCALPVIAVKSDVGMMGGKLAHEFMYLTPSGEDTLLLCDRCGYSANRQVATFRKPLAAAEDPLPVEKVATPGTKSIEDLAQFLDIPKSKTAKAVFLMATPSAGDPPQPFLVFAIVRGDMEVNETKLANATGARELRPATEEEIRAVGAVPGYASPVGLPEFAPAAAGGPGPGDALPVLVVVDDAVPASPNLVAGANEEGYHLRNVNYGRDYTGNVVADIASAQDGDACPQCGNRMQAVRGVEVGHIFQLGTRYSSSMGLNYQDPNGEEKPVIMGSYGIGLGRLMACVAEEHRDEHGLIWPVSLAPYHVHMVLLAGKGEAAGTTAARAQELYNELWRAGIEVLLDDRNESPGVKFNDADLIGIPLRLTVSQRALESGGVEFKRRDRVEKSLIAFEDLVDCLRKEIAAG